MKYIIYMKNYIKMFSFILCNIFCVLGFCVLVFHSSILLLHATYAKLFDIQILLFLFGIFVLFGLFLIILMKEFSFRLKIILLLILLVFQMVYFKVTLFFPTIDKIIENQVCIEMGICNK